VKLSSSTSPFLETHVSGPKSETLAVKNQKQANK